MTTKAEKAYMGRVADLGCYLCQHLGYGPTPAQVHHIREGQGMAHACQQFPCCTSVRPPSRQFKP